MHIVEGYIRYTDNVLSVLYVCIPCIKYIIILVGLVGLYRGALTPLPTQTHTIENKWNKYTENA